MRFAPGTLALAGGLYVLTHITTTLGWLGIIRACGHHLPAREGFAISLVSQAAKYIPGNVAHHIGRAGLVVLATTRARRLVAPILAFAIGLLLAGVSFALLVEVPQAVPAYPVAWLAGFLLPGAPAGLGVREAALLALLDKAVTPEALGGAIIVHRVITAGAGGLVALVAYFAGLAAIHNRAANSGPTSGK